jgi:RND superfamily putative drug exporter
MACVFASFGFAGVRTTSEFGVGLALAVLADAFLLRMTIVPAAMHLAGRRNWALPSWLDRVLPHLSVESGDPAGRQSAQSAASTRPDAVTVR